MYHMKNKQDDGKKKKESIEAWFIMLCQLLTQFYFHVTRLNFSKRKNNNELHVEKRKEKRKQNTKPNLVKMNKIFDASQKQR